MLQIGFEEQDLSIKSILDEKADRLKSLKQISKKAELRLLESMIEKLHHAK